MDYRFNKKYGFIFLTILIIEILIAYFVTNPMIKESIGNTLVIVLIYSLIQTFFDFDKLKTIIGVGIFALLVKVTQLWLMDNFNPENKLLSTLIGNTFDMNDIWAYIAGCALIYMLEFSNENKRPKKRKLF